MTTKKVIGAVTTYHGTEHRYLKGHKVIVVAVLKKVPACNPWDKDSTPDPDDWDYEIIKDDADLARFGGLNRGDRVEVAPWIKEEGRWSFVTSDPLAEDLGAFRSIG